MHVTSAQNHIKQRGEGTRERKMKEASLNRQETLKTEVNFKRQPIARQLEPQTGFLLVLIKKLYKKSWDDDCLGVQQN